ncbi:T9SS type A sorting domain-containing protein [Luteibaculum oceani]|uniref:T9SS type A sorting domain-containing protein n=1 Tax=Luteibaculum oceani TaxID=1294296 RepID=A0A5C6UYL9_9FLAO|nr:T9SS type A sorting domain-containing protein [Luteibaculum oceani]TXC76058.1 T9SS type A sorting domain-containing protein [Luteibaculum oceani]
MKKLLLLLPLLICGYLSKGQETLICEPLEYIDGLVPTDIIEFDNNIYISGQGGVWRYNPDPSAATNNLDLINSGISGLEKNQLAATKDLFIWKGKLHILKNSGIVMRLENDTWTEVFSGYKFNEVAVVKDQFFGFITMNHLNFTEAYTGELHKYDENTGELVSLNLRTKRFLPTAKPLANIGNEILGVVTGEGIYIYEDNKLTELPFIESVTGIFGVDGSNIWIWRDLSPFQSKTEILRLEDGFWEDDYFGNNQKEQVEKVFEYNNGVGVNITPYIDYSKQSSETYIIEKPLLRNDSLFIRPRAIPEYIERDYYTHNLINGIVSRPEGFYLAYKDVIRRRTNIRVRNGELGVAFGFRGTKHSVAGVSNNRLYTINHFKGDPEKGTLDVFKMESGVQRSYPSLDYVTHLTFDQSNVLIAGEVEFYDSLYTINGEGDLVNLFKLPISGTQKFRDYYFPIHAELGVFQFPGEYPSPSNKGILINAKTQETINISIPNEVGQITDTEYHNNPELLFCISNRAPYTQGQTTVASYYNLITRMWALIGFDEPVENGRIRVFEGLSVIDGLLYAVVREKDANNPEDLGIRMLYKSSTTLGAQFTFESMYPEYLPAKFRDYGTRNLGVNGDNYYQNDGDMLDWSPLSFQGIPEGAQITSVEASNNGGLIIATYGNGIYQTQSTTGVSEFNMNDNFLDVYPNPARDIVTINIHPSELNSSNHGVYNLSGKKVGELSIKGDKVQINVSGLENGVYIGKVLNKKNSFRYFKIIKN